jgi:phosphoglycolate phosphatase
VDAVRSLPRFLEIYDGRLLRHTRPYDGIGDAVTHARTHARVIVLTNKPRRPSEQILAGLGLRDLFDDVIGGDGPWPRKPDPAGLRAVMAREGIAPERTLLVGDSAVDLQTARAADALACFAAYGFGAHTVAKAVPADVWVADTPADLVRVIGAFSAGARPAPAASMPPASRS